MSGVVFNVKGRDIMAHVTNDAGEVKDVPVDNAKSGGLKEVLDALGVKWEIKVEPIRVFACVPDDPKDGVIEVFGPGNYVGEEVPPPELGLGDRPIPKVILDQGDAVYGNECWWGERVEEELKAQRLKMRPISVATWRERQAAKEDV